MFSIAENYSSNIFNGDLVSVGGGTLAATAYAYNSSSGSAGAGIGVFAGCEYTTSSSAGYAVGPIYGKNRFQYWPKNTYAQDAVGYVVDDPLAYFRVAVLTQAPVSGTTPSLASITNNNIGYMSQAFVGSNAVIAPGAGGSTSTGDSSYGVTGTNPGGQISSTTGTVNGNLRNTQSSPFRIIQLVPDTAVTVSTTTASTVSSGVVTLSSVTGIQPGMQAIIPGSTGALPGDFVVVGAVVGSKVLLYTAAASTDATQTAATITNAPSGSAISFIGYPEVIVGWNAGYHSYNIAGGV